MKKEIVSTNHDWGFFGTVRTNYQLDAAEAAWLFHYVAIGLARFDSGSTVPPESTEIARYFLDGRAGRHLADEMSYYGAKEWATRKELLHAFRKLATQNTKRLTKEIAAYRAEYEKSEEEA